MSRGLTVSNIIDEVLASLEEENSVQINEDRDILPIINSANKKAYEVLTQVHQAPLLRMADFPISAKVFNLPEDLYQDKIHRCYWVDSGGRKINDCKATGVDMFGDIDGQTSSTYPGYYLLLERSMHFSSVPGGTLRIFYMRDFERLVQPIATVDSLSGTDTLGISELDSSYDFTSGRLGSYVNIVDGQTGIIKATVQVRSQSETEIVIRTNPDRTTVLNRDISTDLTALVDVNGLAVTISADDYICAITGTCVLPYWDLVESFIKQQTIAELKRQLGYAYDVDQQLVSQFRVDMRKAAVSGRDEYVVIRQTNPIWNANRWRI